MGAERIGAPLIVAIDGPSGVGKSSVSRAVARRLGVPFLDTGAMYRAIGLLVERSGVDPADRAAVAALAGGAQVDLQQGPSGEFAVLLDGAPLGEEIRAPRVGEITSWISVYPEVRSRMVELQRACASSHGAVVEGRDIGTKVFPATPHKFFLDARPEVRFQRRYEQLRAGGKRVSLGEVVTEIQNRDHRDRRRTDSPLACDESYTILDTSDLSPEAVVDRIVGEIRGKQGEPSSGP